MRRPTAREAAALSLVLLAACGAALFASWRSWDRARTARDSAAAARGVVLAQLREIAEMRRSEQTLGERPSPQQDLVARMEACAAPIGLGPKPIGDVRAEAPAAIPGTPYRRQRVTVTINPVRPPELARFLHEWRASEPLWTVSSIRMDAERAGRGAGDRAMGAAPEDRFHITLTLESIHLAEPTPASPATPKATEVVDSGGRP